MAESAATNGFLSCRQNRLVSCVSACAHCDCPCAAAAATLKHSPAFLETCAASRLRVRYEVLQVRRQPQRSPSTRPALERIDRSDRGEGGVRLLLAAARGLRLRLLGRACNRMLSRLQPDVIEAATVWNRGCTRMQSQSLLRPWGGLCNRGCVCMSPWAVGGAYRLARTQRQAPPAPRAPCADFSPRRRESYGAWIC